MAENIKLPEILMRDRHLKAKQEGQCLPQLPHLLRFWSYTLQHHKSKASDQTVSQYFIVIGIALVQAV